MTKLWNLVKGEEGLESGEYALLGALILLAIIVSVGALGTQINAVYTAIVAGLTPAP